MTIIAACLILITLILLFGSDTVKSLLGGVFKIGLLLLAIIAVIVFLNI
jgi:hypothetical protein